MGAYVIGTWWTRSRVAREAGGPIMPGLGISALGFIYGTPKPIEGVTRSDLFSPSLCLLYTWIMDGLWMPGGEARPLLGGCGCSPGKAA